MLQLLLITLQIVYVEIKGGFLKYSTNSFLNFRNMQRGISHIGQQITRGIHEISRYIIRYKILDFFQYTMFYMMFFLHKITDMLKVEYSPKRQNLRSCMEHLPRQFWLKMNHVTITFHLICVQNSVHSFKYLTIDVCILNTNDKEKVISYSTIQHALGNVSNFL